ncbi:hypothetical protein TWF192_009854 [Orbilia oligospora]|uniref:Uncharacterized protein n=1 Tax=Orbilia oligospora TaxID=2813651 RepID=A0A6G1MJ78_ORBOL|nr:hypothetical protein TWF191_010196 [Orbilia oligospora]KAF3260573.1 hypothetical protein TWF192_009854 [Orbilia oligospora]
MDLLETPCPRPANRRLKRRRPTSPDPDSSSLPTPSTTDLKSSRPRRSLTSLSILPKRRKIPISLVQKSSINKEPASQLPRSSIGNQSDTSIIPNTSLEESIGDQDESTILIHNRRMSLRSHTIPTSPILPRQDTNSSVLHADISAMDSTSSTIFPTSSPNSSSQSILTKPPAPPPNKRRRISEIVRRVAASAVSKATTSSTNTSKPRTSIARTTTTKPTTTKPTKAIDKKKIPIKPKPVVETKRKTTSTATTLRPALKSISRGMNPPSRALPANDLKKQPSTLNRLRLQKTKSHSDSESFRKPLNPSRKPARKSASSYPPLLSTDQSLKPELYASTAWLSTQETLLTQILDSILIEGTNRPTQPLGIIRRELLSLYNTDAYCLLQDRLKASILHGILKPSGESLSQNPKLSEDLGARDKFTKLFLESYNPFILRLCMEVVTGRLLNTSTKIPTDLEIRKFFDTFFLDINDQNEGGDDQWESYGANAHGTLRVWTETEVPSDKAWALRRTMLRTLLLVRLIDDAKSSGIFGDLVFRRSSEMKSSEEVLVAVGKMVLPSLGNMAKGVKGCGYLLKVEQKSDEEYEYAIKNLRVDLRDGVRLAKVVELVLKEKVEGILMNPKSKGEKLVNVEKVISVLYRNGVVPLGTVRSKDVVDGHREVTLSLLWAVLVEKGVKYLVDFEEVEMEITRLQTKYKIVETTKENESGEEELNKLETWARIAAAGRGIDVEKGIGGIMKDNVLEAVLEEYEPLIDGGNAIVTTTSTEKEGRLNRRLRSFGCSDSFIKAFTPDGKTVVNSRFVLATLAFLASRVLSSTKITRTAAKIQQWWRAVEFRKNISRRVGELLQEAEKHEAAIEEFRRKWAAKRIQRAWKIAVERKVTELVEIVVGIQALARGCLVRKKVDCRYKPGGKKAEKVEKQEEKKEDPYKLKKEEKKGKKGRRKIKHVEAFVEDNYDGGDIDIWQELADGE